MQPFVIFLVPQPTLVWLSGIFLWNTLHFKFEGPEKEQAEIKINKCAQDGPHGSPKALFPLVLSVAGSFAGSWGVLGGKEQGVPDIRSPI